jgi:hypothetical protein
MRSRRSSRKLPSTNDSHLTLGGGQRRLLRRWRRRGLKQLLLLRRGGGGSSYVESSAANVRFWQGWKQPAHNGLVAISW